MIKNIVLFFSLGLFSCGSGTQVEYFPSLIYKDTLTIDFQNFPLPNERSSYGLLKDKYSYSFAFNDSIGIFILDLKSNSWNKYHIPLDGDSGLKRGGNFYFINDTLGLYSLIGSGEFQILDFKSKTTVSYKFDDFRYNIGNSSPGGIYFDNKVIGFPVSYSRSNKEKDYTKNVPIYSFYDLKESRLINSFGFPADFHDKVYSLNHLTRTFLVVGERIYLNMAKSHKLYLFDVNCNLIDEPLISSDKVLETESTLFENPMESLIQFTYGGNYSSLVYDGKYFYRIASFLADKGNSNSDKPSGFLNDLESLKIEVIKFDADFNLISKGEFLASPSKKGIGDGNYFVANGKPYFLLLDKQVESQERFVSVE